MNIIKLKCGEIYNKLWQLCKILSEVLFENLKCILKSYIICLKSYNI